MTRRFIIALMSMLPLAAGADTFDEIMSEVMYNNLTVRAENARAEAQVEGLYGENTLELRKWSLAAYGTPSRAVKTSGRSQ